MTKITGVLQDDKYMYFIISRCILLGIGNVSDKSNGIENPVLCWI